MGRHRSRSRSRHRSPTRPRRRSRTRSQNRSCSRSRSRSVHRSQKQMKHRRRSSSSSPKEERHRQDNRRPRRHASNNRVKTESPEHERERNDECKPQNRDIRNARGYSDVQKSRSRSPVRNNKSFNNWGGGGGGGGEWSGASFIHRRQPQPSQQDEYWERRRFEREKLGFIGVPEIWGLSPRGHDTAESDHDGSGTRRKHADSSSDSSDTHKKKKRKKKGKSKSRKHKHRKHKKNKSKYVERHKHKKEDSSSSEDTEDTENEDSGGEEVWAEVSHDKRVGEKTSTKGEIIGPMPDIIEDDGQQVKLDYGKALLPGEGAAMAAYIAEGKRIPRRGEIGLTPDEIVHYEGSGYVMSGSRHRRMEAVRLRKENQIYSADEKRALAKFNHEERTKRENQILAQFRELVHKKIEEKH
ncbi:hypothetical protein NP493_304g06039 [Ridgeia piscesae]|uniref:NF-kappa-B-activating protein C-terminal domain-containing protein n=1 Tax=Ridgeia piscesae TaxID=27915 RepID=A0AAD9L5P6_RIDPI|nr:hypothetical protein NP493_304g06039 [Ridgeia piscesae]